MGAKFHDLKESVLRFTFLRRVTHGVSQCLEGFVMISGEGFGFNLWQADSLLTKITSILDCFRLYPWNLIFVIVAYFWS